MKVGDLVTALDADRGIGIIKGITYDHKGMSLRVAFKIGKDYGYSMVYRPIDLQIVEAK